MEILKLALLLCIGIKAINAKGRFAAAAYLYKYGYTDEKNQTNLTKAVKEFQKLVELPQTGKLDSKTVAKMKEPRCELSDHDSKKHIWSKHDLTYSISSFTNNLSRKKIKEIIAHAFQIWSDESPLKFTEREPGPTDFNIGFYTKDHHDGVPFNGTSGDVAHAFFPKVGDIHFDDDENWSDDPVSNGFKSLFFIAVHEIGHALGLHHVENKRAIMFPFVKFRGNRMGYRLPALDRYNIEELYGLRPGRSVACKDKSYHCRNLATDKQCKESSVFQERCEKSCGICR